MYRIDNASAAATLPAPTSPGPNPNGYFVQRDPLYGIPGTVVDAEWANAVQEEICHVIEDADAGNTPLSKSSRTQLKAAIASMIAAAGVGAPTGAVTMFAGSSLPAGGWLWCNGQAVSRTTYATLFALIGTTYGAGDGSTTFNLPDLRQRFPLGTGTMGGTSDPGRVTSASVGGSNANTLGGTGGEQTHTLTASEMDHNHALSANSTLADPGSLSYRLTSTTTGGVQNVTATAHNNMPPFIVMNFIIKA